ncbi:MAG: potassium-transporting ATPase subunit KdpC [Myxococcales bacterium]|nr:potassium-transporting ATPase subunit KdpC [Myxococcales bacterium]
MTRTALTALRTCLVTMLLTGLLYPLAITGAAQLMFPHQADGSLVLDPRDSTKVLGSELIGQRFVHPGYLHSRPSAAGKAGWDAAASSGSNLGPTSSALRERIDGELVRLIAENPDAPGPVPAELLTASGSGLDPHLSPDAARWQVPRIAASRGVKAERVHAVVEAALEGREFGMLGEPRINVLLVNLALDRQFGLPTE